MTQQEFAIRATIGDRIGGRILDVIADQDIHYVTQEEFEEAYKHVRQTWDKLFKRLAES